MDRQDADQAAEQGPSHLRLASGSAEYKPSNSRAIHPSAVMRDREHSVGAWSASSVGTGDSRSAASPSVTRSTSRRTNKGTAASRLRGADGKRKIDRHTLALKSIREFLRGRNCYDCLPVSFRLVVLDTKLIVKPALDIMWQAGIVSAPLWQSTTEPFPTPTGSSSNDASALQSPGEENGEVGEAAQLADRADGNAHVASPVSYPSSSLPSAAMLSSFSPMSQSVTAGGSERVAHRENVSTAERTGFAGMLTVNDIIHLIQYYYKTASQSEAAQMVEKFRLGKLREIENTLHVPPPPLLSIDPMRPLFEACQLLLKTHARRLPLLDHDDQTGMDVVVSVLTQYRVLKFIAMNCRETSALHRSIRSLGIGTYIASMSNQHTRSMTAASNVSSSRRSSNAATSSLPSASHPAVDIGTKDDSQAADGLQSNDQAIEESTQERRGSGLDSMYPLATVTLETTVFDVIHIFSELGVSGVPVLDEDGYAVDMYETVDVIDLVRAGAYQQLDLTVREALARRSKDFSGVMTCSPDDSLATIFGLLRTRRVHRMLILEPEASMPTTGTVPGLNDRTDGAAHQEDQQMMNAAIANDTTAVGDGLRASADDSKANQKDPANNSALEDIPHRKRGKLVGILCLSDVMRYLIASPGAQAAEKVARLHGPTRTSSGLAGVGTSFSTAPSSLDATDVVGSAPRSRQASTNGPGATVQTAATAVGGEGEEESAVSTAQGLVAGPSKADRVEVASQADAAARFDPKDVPPTIEEHPTAEATPAPVTQPVEVQTPTQEIN